MAKKRNTEAEQSILNYLAANQKLSTKDAIGVNHSPYLYQSGERKEGSPYLWRYYGGRSRQLLQL